MHLRSFLRACPRHGEAALLLAVQLVKLGENEASTALLEHTLATCFVRPEVLACLHRRLGEIARERGRTSAAVDCFRMALDCDPQSAVLQLALGTALLEDHRHQEATLPLSAAADNGQPLARTNLGICLLQLGRPAEALREFAEAARLLPGNELARTNLQNALVWAQATAAAV
jgi:Flp pilus assembly protein TadD